MRFAKIILIAGLGVFAFLAYMMMSGDDKVEQKYVIQNYTAETKGRADDETYADELRALIKIQQEQGVESKKKYDELLAKYDKVTSYIDSEQNKIKQETDKRIVQINKMLEETKSNIDKLNATQLLERQKLQEKITALSKGEITYEQFNEDAIVQRVLQGLGAFQDQIANDTRTAIQKINDDQKKKEQDAASAKTGFPKFVPKTENVKTETPTGRVKLSPYGVKSEDGKTGGFNFSDMNIFGGTQVKRTSGNEFPFTTPTGQPEKLEPIPVYTIPNTATLVVNSLMTPLIGKVPDHQNNLPDPYRFKFITGADNLATNGLRIPGIQNIVWTGFAVGVRDQSCVRAYVDTITFTFEDGRISTFTKNKGTGGGSTASNAIGYLTDRWGKACIRGQYISNATDYLKDRTLAAFIAGVAEATADSQIEMVQNEQGDWKGFATGNTAQYIAGKGVAGTAKELADFVAKRAVGAFDIIYVETGLNVQLFVETEIPIDYDPNGRKISYDYSEEINSVNHNELD